MPLRTGPSAQNRDRQDAALQLHLAGVPHAAIAERLGYRSASSATSAVRQALARSEPAELPGTEVARLDRLLRGLWPKAARGDVQAVDRVLQIEDRRRQIAEREAEQTERDNAEAHARTGLSDFTERLRARDQRTGPPAREAPTR